MEEPFMITAQRDLVADAHRAGILNLQVLALLTDRHQVMLVEHGRTLPGRTPHWTVPNLFVLPGELISDTLERLCCQHLRIDTLACPASFLGANTLAELDVVQFLFAFDVGGLPYVFTPHDADVGPHHWWNTQDGHEPNLYPGIRRSLATVYLLPHTPPPMWPPRSPAPGTERPETGVMPTS